VGEAAGKARVKGSPDVCRGRRGIRRELQPPSRGVHAGQARVLCLWEASAAKCRAGAGQGVDWRSCGGGEEAACGRRWACALVDGRRTGLARGRPWRAVSLASLSRSAASVALLVCNRPWRRRACATSRRSRE